MPKKTKKEKVVVTKNKNKNRNQINININSNNKKRSYQQPRPQQSHAGSVVVSSGIPYQPSDSGLHHIYPIIQSLTERVNSYTNKEPTKEMVQVPSYIETPVKKESLVSQSTSYPIDHPNVNLKRGSSGSIISGLTHSSNHSIDNITHSSNHSIDNIKSNSSGSEYPINHPNVNLQRGNPKGYISDLSETIFPVNHPNVKVKRGSSTDSAVLSSDSSDYSGFSSFSKPFSLPSFYKRRFLQTPLPPKPSYPPPNPNSASVKSLPNYYKSPLSEFIMDHPPHKHAVFHIDNDSNYSNNSGSYSNNSGSFLKNDKIKSIIKSYDNHFDSKKPITSYQEEIAKDLGIQITKRMKQSGFIRQLKKYSIV